MKTERKVSSLDGLMWAATNKRAVFCPRLWPWKNPTPAAFVINLQGRIIYQMIKSGMYIYQADKGKS
jgi:hypothetical protein